VARQVNAPSLEAFAAAGADLAATVLAERYAVAGDDGGDLRYRIRVEGIDSYTALRSLQGALQGVEAIERVVPERVAGREVVLRIESAATLPQLGRIIELDPRFAPLAGPTQEGQLDYRWEE
jgi:hypothetical protein